MHNVSSFKLNGPLSHELAKHVLHSAWRHWVSVPWAWKPLLHLGCHRPRRPSHPFRHPCHRPCHHPCHRPCRRPCHHPCHHPYHRPCHRPYHRPYHHRHPCRPPC